MAQSFPIVIDPNLLGSGAVAGVGLQYALNSVPNLPKMSILGVSSSSGEEKLPETRFQYWPESIEDSIEVGWEFTSLPATSHGLAHWTQNGGRTITFEATFARDMQYNPKPHMFLSADPKATGVKQFNGTPDYMIKYLRAFVHPERKKDGTVLSPPIAHVHLAGTSIGADGSDIFKGVMTQCDVSYKRISADGDDSGFTRLAVISLSFREVIQDPKSKKFNYHYLDTYEQAMDSMPSERK